MNENKFTIVGVIGALFAALCCFTPLLPIVLPAIGLGGLLGYIYNDAVLLSALAIFLVIAGMGFGKARPPDRATIFDHLPECGHIESETMPTDACQWFYDCKGCNALLKPKDGDWLCLLFLRDSACPPIQEGESCCS